MSTEGLDAYYSITLSIDIKKEIAAQTKLSWKRISIKKVWTALLFTKMRMLKKGLKYDWQDVKDIEKNFS